MAPLKGTKVTKSMYICVYVFLSKYIYINMYQRKYIYILVYDIYIHICVGIYIYKYSICILSVSFLQM